jgi:hypothetical protein
MSPLLPVALALLAAVQQQARVLPTVGDTVWVRRSIPLPDRYTARAADWELTGDVELLGPPELVLGKDSVTVRYPLVAWTAGTHRVEIPSPTLLAPDGAVDSLGPAAVTFTVRSLLPDRPPSQLQPQPPAGLVTRRTVSLLPPLLFLAGAPLGLLLGADPLLFGPLLGGVLFLDSLLLDLAELAEGEENRAFFLLCHRRNLVSSGSGRAPRLAAQTP